MTISSSDIRLLESERMTDNTDGGGRRTSRVIPDGVAGNIFPKVSRVDSVYGRVNLRKVYPHINTASLDVYAGAHFVITDAPDNDRISVLAFSTGSDFDLRTSARDRIESYVIAGPESRMVLYGRQLLGAQALLVYQRKEEPLPEIGDVYAISTEVGGITTAQQFVAVQDVEHELRTFTDDAGDFQRLVITLKIGAPLRYEFAGIASPSRRSADSGTAKIRITTVADASRYVGIQPLTAAVAAGTLELPLASVYAPIVPSTQRETALSLATVAGAAALLPAASAPLAEVYFPGAVIATAPSTTIYLPRPAVPGSVRLRVVYLAESSPTVPVGLDGTAPPMVVAGWDYKIPVVSVDHETGVIRLGKVVANGAQAPGNVYVTYTPAALAEQPAHTKAIEITLGTRGTVYSVPLLPIPAPGTLIVDYRALGKWYRLRDNGAGELVGGDAAYGTGTVDYVTGGAVVTLGALPDVGSSVLLSWGSPAHYQILAATPASGFDLMLSPAPVKPGSVVLTWTEGITAKTAHDNGSGALTGDATGTIVYQSGALKLVLPKPIAGSVGIAFDRDTPPTTAAATGLSHAFGGALAPHSVSVTDVGLTLPNGLPYTGLRLVDNGAGQLLIGAGGTGSDYIGLGEYYVPRAQVFGSVNYATGMVTVSASVPVSRLRAWNSVTGTWDADPAGTAAIHADAATYSALPTATAPDRVAQSTSATLGTAGTGLTLQLGPQTPMTIVPGSVMFTAFGKTYVDRNGTLYTDLSAATGSGMPVGSIDYTTGAISLTSYPSATAANFIIVAALGRKGSYTAQSVFFRTAGSPLRPASLYVQCAAADGELLVGTTDQNGVITGGMDGQAEQTMGVVRASFAKPVLPGTLRYSAVVLGNMPLNADVLGLDPVRLPSDGRVPIFRPADVALLHHTESLDLGTPTAGATFSMGRTNLSQCWLEDATKRKLSSSLYAVDLAAGSVTMSAALSLAGYTTPITARHRIEEMLLLSDVQINGQVSLTGALTRDFPAGSYLSGALLYGDLQARATNFFDQQTWTGTWKDAVDGPGATAQYNDIDYPVEVLNNGAVSERWRLHFTSTTAFQIIGENLGVIGTGTTTADVQPVNALTSLPYFTLRAAGFGSGWAAGNQIRFNTIAAAPPTWLARTVLPGATLGGDSFDAQLRGDVD